MVRGQHGLDRFLQRHVDVALGEGVEVRTLYTGSLGAPGSGADTYVGMMRTNAATIADALGS